MNKLITKNRTNSNTKKLLELNSISFSYTKKDVVKDVSMSIKKGDFIGLIGPNGSGKTTLLKIILGIIKPRKGTIKLFGKEISKFSEWNKIGYVPQKATNIEKNFPATVYEVVAMGLLSSKKFPKILNKIDNEKIIQALSIVKMLKYKDSRISELSGGEQQRVLIAKAIITNPEILILDEPTTGVDQQNQKSFYFLLGKLNQDGITIILVSHDVNRITKYVTKVASINQTLKFYGSHKEFCANDPDHEQIHDHLNHHKHEHKHNHEEHELCFDK
ncbi:MAG: metal ABC transporter ATP-binding protein [Candidatus Woesearchaeota archaeon]